MAILTITLPDDLAQDLRARAAAGGYPDESAMIADLLRDAADPPDVSAWLRHEVPQRLAAFDAGTEPLFSSDELRAQLAGWCKADR